MRTFKLLIASALLATSMVAPAQEAPISIAHEIGADGYSFPSSALGTLVIKGCTACKTYRFELTSTTEYWIGNQQVSQAELRAAFAAAPQALTLLKLENNRRDVDLIFIDYYPAPAKR